MTNFSRRFIPLVLAFSTAGLSLTGCSSSSSDSPQDAAALSDNDFASASTALTDQDFSGAGNPAKPNLAAGSHKANDLYSSGPAPRATQQIVLPKSTMPTPAVASTTQAGGSQQQTAPAQQQPAQQQTASAQPNNSGNACVQGAKKAATYGVLGTLGLAAIDTVLTGGMLTLESIIDGVIVSGAKSAATGCVAATVTGNPNIGVTAIPPQAIRPATPAPDLSGVDLSYAD